MYSLEEQLKKVLEKFCTDQKARPGEYEVVVGQTSLGRVYAIVVWNRFDSMEVTQRQKMVWDYLWKKMKNPEDRKNISAIYTRGMMEWVAEEEIKAQATQRLPWM